MSPDPAPGPKSRPGANPDANATPGPFGLPRWAVWAIGVLVVLLLGFGSGFFTAAGPVQGLREELADAEARTAAEQDRAARLEAELRARSAVIQLYGAARALQASNFGLAEERLERARGELEGLPADLVGVDAAALDALRAEVAEAGIEVSVNVAPQSEGLSRLADRLQSLVGS